MVLQIGETRHPKKMTIHGDVHFPEKLGLEDEAHSHNVYKKDKHHLRLGNGL